MHLEFTPEQQSFQRQVESFAREHVEPLAATIDETGQFPRALITPGGRARPLRDDRAAGRWAAAAATT